MTDTKLDIKALRKELGLDKVDTLLETQAKAQRDADEKAANEKADARMKSFVDNAMGETQEKLKSALDLIEAMDTASKASAETFAKAVETSQEQIVTLQDEIKSLMARREGKDVLSTVVGKTLRNVEDKEALMEDAAFVKALTRSENIEDTAFGAEIVKAVNDSSSIQVSSEDYETVFSNRILRDIQKKLIVGDLFMELPMTSKLLTMQIEDDRTSTGATWVDSADFGTDASTGGEHTTALTNLTFQTHKLACKAYMTDETTEDAITPLLGIIRRRLIEAHVEAIENAFMTGDGVGKPLGLITTATNDTTSVASAYNAGATGAVVATELLAMRRTLGRKGTRLSELALIVSLDVYYDLIEDNEWQDVQQVGSAAAKLQGQVGRIYGMDVVVSEYFPAKAVGAVCATLVYKADYIVPRQRAVTTEFERIQRQQVDAYYVTQRVNLQRYFGKGTDHANVCNLTYAAA